MHTHTTHSACSVLDVHDLISVAGHLGIDGLCITDHQTMDIRHHITEGIQANGVIVIFGMEYETPDGDFLIFGPYENISQKMSAAELLRHVSETGGAAIAAHPFRKGRSVSEHLLKSGAISIVENINGRNTTIENLKMEKWGKHFNFIQTGGSDAHTPNEIGSVVTHFTVPVKSRADLISALQRGLCHPEDRLIREKISFS